MRIEGNNAKILIKSLEKGLLRDYLFSYLGTEYLMREQNMTDPLVCSAPECFLISTGPDWIEIEIEKPSH